MYSRLVRCKICLQASVTARSVITIRQKEKRAVKTVSCVEDCRRKGGQGTNTIGWKTM